MLPSTWGDLATDSFKNLAAFVDEERRTKTIYPPAEQVFRAFNQVPLDRVKIVILGQDPYHGEGQANGLAFSVNDGVKLPPSLKNIFKELEQDIGVKANKGDLSAWADRGVLLLNSILTVEASKPTSHQKRGWEKLTDAALTAISNTRTNVVFLLWGSYAISKASLIDKSRHCILTAPHPSPLSAHKGFLGCKHFSKANEFLIAHKIQPIDWSL